MDNINFSLIEIEPVNKIISLDTSSDHLSIDDFLLNDMEGLKLYYNQKYTIKQLSHILQYYGIHKAKMIKDEMLQVLLFFETEPSNKLLVERRIRLWNNIHELKADSYFSKYILF
jgi:hypothetical protein